MWKHAQLQPPEIGDDQKEPHAWRAGNLAFFVKKWCHCSPKDWKSQELTTQNLYFECTLTFKKLLILWKLMTIWLFFPVLMDAPQCSYCISTWKAHEQPWTGRLSQHTATWLRPACSHCSHTICPLICGTISWSWWCPTICDKYMRLNMSIINHLTQILTQKLPDTVTKAPAFAQTRRGQGITRCQKHGTASCGDCHDSSHPKSPNLNPCDIPLSWLV